MQECPAGMQRRPKVGAVTGSAGRGRAAESEEWVWMVGEDPAFYLEEAGPAPDKRAG